MSFQQKKIELSEALNDFDKVIIDITNDLDNYKKKGVTSQKYIYYKQGQISDLERLRNMISLFMEQFANDYKMISGTLGKANRQIKKHEVIALIHGITDLKDYTKWSYEELETLLKRAYSEKWRQTPKEIFFSEGSENKNLGTIDKPVVSWGDFPGFKK
jgi:hypothetical protein